MTGQLKGKADLILGGQNTKEEMIKGSKSSRMVRDCEKEKSKTWEENVWGGGGILQPSNPPLESLPGTTAIFQKAFYLLPCKKLRAKCLINLSKGHFGFSWQSCAHLAWLPDIHFFLPNSNGNWHTHPIPTRTTGTNGWFHRGSSLPGR